MPGALSPEIIAGLWAAWTTSQPLTVAGRQIYVTNEMADRLFPDAAREWMELATESDSDTPPEIDYRSPDHIRNLARHVAFNIGLASAEIERLGIDLGAIATTRLAEGHPGVGGEARFEAAPTTFGPLHPIRN